MTTIRVNGTDRSIDADPQMPLLWAIRDVIGLTGTKFGCGVGACGACTVHMDGMAVRSCVTALADAQGGSAPRCSFTTATRPSIPLRKSTGFVAIRTRPPLGGMQELGETIEDCARRELLEETGIEALPVRVMSGANAIRRDGEGRIQTHFTLIAVLLDWQAGEGAPLEDATEVGWFSLNEAAALDTFPDALPMMRLALAG